MIPTWLEAILDQLSTVDRQSSRVFMYADGRAIRRGRNDAWGIRRQGDRLESYFAKFWNSQRLFRREVFGLQMMQRLASTSSYMAAAEVIHTDEERGLIVTSNLEGKSLFNILKYAFRIDRYLYNSRNNVNKYIEKTFECLQLLMNFISEFQNQSICSLDQKIDFVSHDIKSVINRINKKLDIIFSDTHFSQERIFCQFPKFVQLSKEKPVFPSHLVHGDLSPGNIIFDGTRIGVIDFEDLGIGPYFRDVLWIVYTLNPNNRRLLYNSCTRIIEFLKLYNDLPVYQLVYKLDFSLTRLLSLKQSRSPKFLRCSILKRYHKHSVCLEIINLYQIACHENLLKSDR
jgi:hypothetical protein